MSEGHGDPPADVRSFLPRPGEPVEQYAERLRALHRDLTLVLQAVERGLAAAARPEDVGPPVPAHEPIEIVPERAEDPAPVAAPPITPRGRMPRVEVMPAPAGEQRRDDQQDRRRPPAPEPAARFSKAGEPASAAAPTPAAPEADDGMEASEAAGRTMPKPARFPARPSVASEGQTAEPRWVERGEAFTTPTFPPGRTGRLQVSPLLATAFVVAWLVVVGLLIALLVS